MTKQEPVSINVTDMDPMEALAMMRAAGVRPTYAHACIAAATKQRYDYRWLDMWSYNPNNASKPMPRARLAYLLRAARSRGEAIHVVKYCNSRKGYILGNLQITPSN